jgi:flavodoxin
MKSLVLFESTGGNTEKVARAIAETLAERDVLPHLVKVDARIDLDFYEYDLVFIGSPVIDWLPAPAMMDFVKRKMKAYSAKGLIMPAAPVIPGKFAACFGTFAGLHIGEKEALPMTMWLRSFLEHLRFTVLDTWHVAGGFGNRQDLNVGGRLGDIRNRPNDSDIADIKNRVMGLLAYLEAWRN